MGCPGGLCCPALVTSMVELVAAVTAVSSEIAMSRLGKPPKSSMEEKSQE